MPLLSNSQSVIEGKPSLLAFIETLAATGFSLWLAWARHSIDHLLVASALAPFLLLRTRLSTRYSVAAGNKLMRYDDLTEPSYGGLVLILALIPMKLFTSAKVFSRHPLKSISAVPWNYYRQVFALDFFSPPTLYPGSEDIDDQGKGVISMTNAYFLIKVTFF
jgi:hypothetical protein